MNVLALSKLVGQVVGKEETRIRPTGIAARSERELLCVWVGHL